MNTDLAVIIGLIFFVISFNILNRYRTYRSVDKEIQKLNWKDLPLNQYILKSYNHVSDRFTSKNKVWLRRPWRNLFFRNLWKMKGKGIPCHMQSFFFQRLLEKRMKKHHIRTKMLAFRKGMLLHFYSQIKLRGKWIDVDVWGKRWGIPFGKNVKNTKLKKNSNGV